jgi:phosphotriesterase-related protein
MAAEIRTVLGPIPPGKLGFTSMHEHVLLDLRVYRRLYEDRIPQEEKRLWEQPLSIDTLPLLRKNALLLRDNAFLDDEAHMAEELVIYGKSGGDALLDLSVVGIRLDMTGVKELSAKTGVHIVASTGFYIEPSWPEEIRGWSAADFEEQMVAEITEGIGDTGVRAGHIKVGITDLSTKQRSVLVAAARTALETGASITAHPGGEPGNDGLAVSEILIAEGVAPDRIVIAHTDNRLVSAGDPPAIDQSGLEYHRALLDRGVNISLDAFGMVGGWEAIGLRMVSDWERFSAVVELTRLGFGGQIVLGCDNAYNTATYHYGGGGYCHLPKNVVPMLRLVGVSEIDIRRMTIDTPARILAMN